MCVCVCVRLCHVVLLEAWLLFPPPETFPITVMPVVQHRRSDKHAFIIIIFLFSHLADAFIQSNLQMRTL